VLSLLVCLGLDLAGGAERPPATSTERSAPRGASTSIAGLPIDFVENRGQWATPARFVAHADGVAAAIEPRAIRLRVGASFAPMALVFEGASDRVAVAGERRRAGAYNYFIGNDASAWRTGVPAYAAVVYRGMYDGVDVRVRDGGGRLEYDLLVAPGADLRRVVIRVDGATRVETDASGQLLLHTPDGALAQTPPSTFETLPDGRSRRIGSRFRVIDGNRYGFEAPSRDASLPLVVDPGLVWSSFAGGTGGKTLSGIEMARDGSGDIFLAGITSSPDFGATPTPHGTSRQHSYVARIRGGGNALVYLTFLSGLAGQTFAGDMTGDPAGGVVVAGSTADRDYPTTPGAFQRQSANTSLQSLDGDGFVTRLDAAGAIVSSTYLGGALNDGASEVRFDPSGAIVVAGVTRSAGFPTTAGAYDTSFNTPPAGDNTALAEDMFITRFTPDLSAITYSTFFGGETYEVPGDMVIDANGFVTVGGATTSSATGRDIPITAGAFDSTWNGSDDGFIARFKLDGNGTADLTDAAIRLRLVQRAHLKQDVQRDQGARDPAHDRAGEDREEQARKRRVEQQLPACNLAREQSRQRRGRQPDLDEGADHGDRESGRVAGPGQRHQRRREPEPGEQRGEAQNDQHHRDPRAVADDPLPGRVGDLKRRLFNEVVVEKADQVPGRLNRAVGHGISPCAASAGMAADAGIPSAVTV
jgi:hypothetical protein